MLDQAEIAVFGSMPQHQRYNGHGGEKWVFEEMCGLHNGDLALTFQSTMYPSRESFFQSKPIAEEARGFDAVHLRAPSRPAINSCTRISMWNCSSSSRFFRAFVFETKSECGVSRTFLLVSQRYHRIDAGSAACWR